METLTVNITPITSGALSWLTANGEDTLTDAINRAIQVYTRLEQLRASGAVLLCRHPDEETLQEIKYY